jgi:hypothetical protein
VPPTELDRRFVAVAVPWSFTRKVDRVEPGDTLVVRTNCPGILEWRFDSEAPASAEMLPTGGVMAGPKRYQHALGIPAASRSLVFSFRCTSVACDCNGRLSRRNWRVLIEDRTAATSGLEWVRVRRSRRARRDAASALSAGS